MYKIEVSIEDLGRALRVWNQIKKYYHGRNYIEYVNEFNLQYAEHFHDFFARLRVRGIEFEADTFVLPNFN